MYFFCELMTRFCFPQGIVTTTRITHATPAALYSHIQHRNWEADSYFPEGDEYKRCDDIAKQLIYNNPGLKLDLIFGGGKRNFVTKSEGGKRNDENLIEAWKEKKKEQGNMWSVFLNKNELEAWNQTGSALGLFSMSHMDYVLERNVDEQPSLDLMVEQAIKRLKKNPNGFFLMVEGGRIDHAHHKNWAKKALEETLELEKAVKIASDLTKEEEETTLMVVTADHSHSLTINGYPQRGNNILGEIFYYFYLF